MFKVLTVVSLIFTCTQGFANELDFNAAFNTKKVVKMKLWYFGVAGKYSKSENTKIENSVYLSEELAVALDKYESIID